MKKWQILEFDGKPYYAFVPENDDPLDINELPETERSEALESSTASYKDHSNHEDDINDNEENLYQYVTDIQNEEETEIPETKPLILNGTKKNANAVSRGNLYQVKLEGSMVTLEKLTENVENEERTPELAKFIKQEAREVPDEPEDDFNEVPEEEHETVAEEEGEEVESIIENIFPEQVDEPDELVEEVPRVITQSPSRRRTLPRSLRMSMIPKSTGGPLKCKACSETFSSATAFRKHVAWTHKKKVCIQENGTYICAVCDYRTLKKPLFADHLNRKHETWTRKRESNVLFPCEACGFVCRSKHSLQSHFIRKHTDSYEHNCQFCEKKFKVKGDLTNHVRFHHKEKPINCDVCGKLCQNTGSLYVHQKWAHYKPKYECRICKRRMVTQENLDQHLITQHEQREKIVCAQCGKTFTKKDSFKRHMAVHTGSKPHSCPICTKPFARQSQLRQHVLIHTGQRPFVCDICGKGFTQKPGLICHRKTHPGQHPPLPVMPIADLVREFIAQNEESQSQELELE